MIALTLMLLLTQVQSWPEPGQVTSTIDKAANFAAAKTYAWEKGLEVFDRNAHKALVAAVEAELASRGLKPADAKTADVIVRYDGMGSTYVDVDELERLTKKDPNAVAPTKAMGSLAISMRRNGSSQRMWRGIARDFVDMSPAARDASIGKIVARVFSTYPAAAKP
jgi:hypothetical protein